MHTICFSQQPIVVSDGDFQTNPPTNRWGQVGMILVVVLLVLLYADPYRYDIGRHRFWLCVFSLRFDL